MLKTLRPVLSSLPPRLGHAPGDTKAIDAARNVSNKARSWYGTKAWQEMKLRVFVRDNYTCRRSGVLCIGKYPAENSPVANHKIPHRGDPKLFWDEDNVETVSKAVHDSIIQAEEQAHPIGFWG